MLSVHVSSVKSVNQTQTVSLPVHWSFFVDTVVVCLTSLPIWTVWCITIFYCNQWLLAAVHNITYSYYCKTLFFRRILILRFPYVENSLHFNFPDFPVNFIKQLVSCFFWCLKQMLLSKFVPYYCLHYTLCLNKNCATIHSFIPLKSVKFTTISVSYVSPHFKGVTPLPCKTQKTETGKVLLQVTQ